MTGQYGRFSESSLSASLIVQVAATQSAISACNGAFEHTHGVSVRAHVELATLPIRQVSYKQSVLMFLFSKNNETYRAFWSRCQKLLSALSNARRDECQNEETDITLHSPH
jgi:hypothetical protein